MPRHYHVFASSIINKVDRYAARGFCEQSAMCEIYQPVKTAAYKFMNAFLRKQKNVNGGCSTLCPNLNSCIPKQIMTQSWCEE